MMYRLKICRGLGDRAPRVAVNWLTSFSFLRSAHSLSFATVEVNKISGSQPAEVYNFVQGKWTGSSKWNMILDPLNGESFIKVAEVDENEIQPFVDSLSKCPKHGLHNPFKAPERYLMYGDISKKAGHMLSQPEVSDFFARLIQRVSPKSYQQAFGEVFVTQKFLENFCGDQVRFLARSFAVPGNHLGQQSHGFRWPYGPVALITPFNFPLEIPVLQLMGALYMGNKPVLKVDSKVCIVMEQMLRLLHDCGLPVEDVDFINSDGKTMNTLLLKANPRMTLFTGSSRVADKLAIDLKGRIKLEDAGFDWKILGPDVQEMDYVAWVCDQDAYACSGQKCSAQSILFMHEFTTEAMLEHMNKLLQIPGSKLLFGGKPLENHCIPPIYGAIKPTAIYVPLEEILKDSNFDLVTKEIFGPFQIITKYMHDQIPLVLNALEKMHAHLTAAVVSNDLMFLQARKTMIVGLSIMKYSDQVKYDPLAIHTVNLACFDNYRKSLAILSMEPLMLDYAREQRELPKIIGMFGPAGDPRGAGIGTPEAIKLVWSCHREIIYDVGPVPQNWEVPLST
ncbi:Aldehyde dehydrogenase domain [Dillenia turbinata]|uniref:Aldehyde dehydrogenase domain n=1 Tax=Dillenia turbinata TaxID=194707 RepID=A0AAN8UZE0_9MAGN